MSKPGQGEALTTEATVAVVCCPVANIIAVSLGRVLYMAQYSADFSQTEQYATWTSPEGDDIRALAFACGVNQHTSLKSVGPVLAVAGDLKQVKLVAPFATGAAADSSKMVLSTYGPHIKKIQVITPVPTSKGSHPQPGRTVVNSFLLADKFGDVLLHHVVMNDAKDSVLWAPEDPGFSLQHLSIFTSLALVPGSTKSSPRMISCDRDNHVRVSRYPDTHYIDNYLWGPRPQTCVAVIATSPVFADKQDEVIVALGGGCGRICFWKLLPTAAQVSDVDSNKNPLEILMGTVDAQGARGAVAGLVWLGKATGGSEGAFCAAFERSHCIHGFVGTTEVVPIELEKDQGEVVSLVSMGNAAVALQRSGQVTVVSLGENNQPTATRAAHGADQLVAALHQDSVAKMLAEVDIQGLWKLDWKEKASARKEDGEDEDEDAAENGEGKRPRSANA